MIGHYFLDERTIRFSRGRARTANLPIFCYKFRRIFLVHLGGLLLPGGLLRVSQVAPLVANNATDLTERCFRMGGHYGLPTLARVQNVTGDQLFAFLFGFFARGLRCSDGNGRHRGRRGNHIRTDGRWAVDRVIDDAELVLDFLQLATVVVCLIELCISGFGSDLLDELWLK